MAASEMTIAFDVFQFLTIENFSLFVRCPGFPVFVGSRFTGMPCECCFINIDVITSKNDLLYPNWLRYRKDSP